MVRIDSVTIHRGHLQPDNPDSWVLNVVCVEAEGRRGWGEAATTYHRASEGIGAVLEVLARRVLVGSDAMANEQLWRQMVAMVDANYHGGAIGFGAVSALDNALWDLKGKLLNQPVHVLLGGAVRKHLRAYANGWCYDLTEPSQYAQAARKVKADGFTAMKFDPFRYDEGGFAEHPRPGGSTTRRWMNIAMDRIEAVRDAVGPDVDILLEAHAKFSPQVAIEIGRRAAQYDMLFYEEPIRSFDPAVMRRVADNQPIPLAAGERIVRFDELRPFVDAQAFALCQTDIGVVGGISASRRMAEYCATRGIGYQSHNCALELNTAAAVSLSAALPNFIIQEVFPYRPEDWRGQVADAFERRIEAGYIPVSDEPGLGVRVDEDWLSARLEKVVME
jgi:galactonate dehydratase